MRPFSWESSGSQLRVEPHHRRSARGRSDRKDAATIGSRPAVLGGCRLGRSASPTLLIRAVAPGRPRWRPLDPSAAVARIDALTAMLFGPRLTVSDRRLKCGAAAEGDDLPRRLADLEPRSWKELRERGAARRASYSGPPSVTTSRSGWSIASGSGDDDRDDAGVVATGESL